MDNLKKVGLSALAGSLVAFSAQAGELSVSGGAKMTYTADTGNEDVAHDGTRFGLQKSQQVIRKRARINCRSPGNCITAKLFQNK